MIIILSTHFQGKITEMQVATAFLQLGYQVSQPLVSDSRYDFIVDINNKLYRIQVKKVLREKMENILILQQVQVIQIHKEL